MITLLRVVLNIIQAQHELVTRFWLPFNWWLWLSFELLLAQLNETAVRLEQRNSLDEIVQEHLVIMEKLE